MKKLKKIFFLFGLYFSGISAFAQNENIDSLKKVLHSLKDTARIDCLGEIAKHYLMTFNKDSSAYFMNIVYEESKKINYLHGIAVIHIQKAAFANHFFHDYFEMEKQAKEALKWFDKTNNKKLIEVAYWQIAAAIFTQYRYEEAEPYLDLSYYWAQKNKNKDWMYNVLGFRYENYRDIGDYEKAFDAFQKVEQLNETFYGKKDTLYENYVLAELQRRIGNYSIALDYYRKVIEKMDLPHVNIWFRISYPELFALNEKFDSAKYYYNLIDSNKLSTDGLRFYLVSLGEFYLLQKKYTDAIGPLLHSLHLHREASDITQINRALIDISKTYAAIQKDKEEMAYGREGLDLALRSQSKQYIRDAYQIFYEIYHRNNNSDSAFTYYQKYIAQKEIVANDLVKGKFAAYNYNQQINLLNKEKQLQQQQLKQSTQQKQFLIIGLVILFILAFVIFRNISLKRKNEANRREIAESELQLQKLESEKTKAELHQQASELEMQALRAQMNPHFIFNSLNAINRFILQNNRAQASEYLTKFSKLVRMILQNSQASSISLENELDSLKLYLELESLRFENHFNYKIVVSDEVDADALKVPPLIIQPYVENAIWHGLMHKEEKGNLEIEITEGSNYLLFKIKDDGIGRKQAATLASKSATRHKSMGMQITANRIEMLQHEKSTSDTITITDLILPDGSPGGTEVLIKIPRYYD